MNSFRYHAQSIRRVLGNFWHDKVSTSLVILVVAVTTTLPSFFYLGVSALEKFSTYAQHQNEISVFMTTHANTADIKRVEQYLMSNPLVAHFNFVGKEQAWLNFQKQSETATLINQLEQNPLPDAFFIQPVSQQPNELQGLQKNLQDFPNVAQVLLNTEWAKHLFSFTVLAKKIILFIAVLLGAGLAIVIGNTIRMQVLAQKEEIEVSHFMGATDSFIRLPFLYAGASYGLLGGAFALLLLNAAMIIFGKSALQITGINGTYSSMNVLPLSLEMMIVGITFVISWLGSYMAVVHVIRQLKLDMRSL